MKLNQMIIDADICKIGGSPNIDMEILFPLLKNLYA